MAHKYTRRGKYGTIYYYIDYYEKGVRVRKAVGTIKRIAEEAKKDVEVRIAKGLVGFPVRKDTATEKLIEAYLNYSKTNKTPAGYNLDCQILLKSFLPFLKKQGYKQVSPLVLEKFKSQFSKNHKPATLNRWLTTIKAMYNRAVEWELLTENPIAVVKKIKSEPGIPRFLSSEEVDSLLREAKGRMKPMILFFLYTGLRASELLNLKWIDVDSHNAQLIIRKTKGRKPRFIPLKEELRSVLKGLPRNSDYVFPSTTGGRITNNNLRRDLLKIMKRAKITGATPHTLRHTFASHLVLSGVPLRVVQELLGHADIRTTMIYSHLSPSHLREGIEKLQFGHNLGTRGFEA